MKLNALCVIAQPQKQNTVKSKAKSCALSWLEGGEPAANKQWCLPSSLRNSYNSLPYLPLPTWYFHFVKDVSLLLCTHSFSFLCPKTDSSCLQGCILFQWSFGWHFMFLMPLPSSWARIPKVSAINRFWLCWSCKDLWTYLAFLT